MESCCDHSRQHIEWRFDVDHAVLNSPRPESIHLEALLYGNRAVLVPRERPVPAGAFVKQYGADRLTSATQNRRWNSADRAGGFEEGPHFRNAGEPHSCLVLRLGGQCGVKIFQFDPGEGGSEDLRAVFTDRQMLEFHNMSTIMPRHPRGSWYPGW